MSERYQRHSSILHSTLEEDVVALSVDRGLCYAMPGITAVIWHSLEKPRSLDDLTKSLMADYAVDEATCRRDVEEVLAKMESEGLVSRLPA